MYKVLLVDDEVSIIESRSKIIEDLGYQCLTANNGKRAIELVRDEHPNVVLTDIKMPQNDGYDVLNSTKDFDPNIPVILFTGHGSIESAVKAMKMGAFDYILKPVSPEIMEVILNKAIDYQRLKRENLILKSQIKETYQLKDMIGESQLIQDVAKRVQKVAQSDVNVFIYGESGTGKELIAQNIHYHSRRSEKPFIPLDIVSLPGSLIESELFGYEKGAFTGAINSKPGLFEIAEGGTLFLDEITEMDINLQAKLLRILQERKFRRLGSTKLIDLDVRIISATNVIPEEAVEKEKLRQDLYFRLNVVPINLPPLRNRKEDIPLLVQHFIKKFSPSSPREIKGISKDAMKYLKQYDWPGNVRELQNIIERAMSLADQDILCPDDLPDQIRTNEQYTIDESLFRSLNFQQAKEKILQEFSKKYLENLLRECDGNISEAARRADMSRWTIYRILKNGNNKNNL